MVQVGPGVKAHSGSMGHPISSACGDSLPRLLQVPDVGGTLTSNSLFDAANLRECDAAHFLLP